MIRLLCHRLRPPPITQAVERDSALEGVRGACALLVFVAHLLLPFRVLDPVWTTSQRSFWINLGYPAVLMFFVLSGYVIGLITTQPAKAATIQHYLRHRAARLLPLNTVAVLICWLLLVHVETRTILGNLLFLQNDEPYPGLGRFSLLGNNPNLWSLNYEAVYYLGFIALWFWAPPVGVVFGGLAALVCAHVFGLPAARIFARYACGGFYWCSGLAVAWLCARPETAGRRGNWPAVVLIAYAIWIFSPLRALLIHAEWYGWIWPTPTPVSPHRLDFLPVCVWLLLTITGRAPAFQRWLAWICLALAAVGLAGRIRSADWQEIDTVASIAFVAAVGLVRREFSLRPLELLAPVGAVSFGLYIIAAPLQLGQRAIAPGFSGSALTFSVRLVLVVLLVAGAAWWLERRLCLPLSRWIRRVGTVDLPNRR